LRDCGSLSPDEIGQASHVDLTNLPKTEGFKKSAVAVMKINTKCHNHEEIPSITNERKFRHVPQKIA
jgi:hypothetical protein